MLKVHVDYDEWYPVYELTDEHNFSTVIELPEETVERVKNAFTEFREVQKILRDAYKIASGTDKDDEAFHVTDET